jgi:hypothetical protein
VTSVSDQAIYEAIVWDFSPEWRATTTEKRETGRVFTLDEQVSLNLYEDSANAICVQARGTQHSGQYSGS